MKSTDNTINPPIPKVELNVNDLYGMQDMKVLRISKDEYDAIGKHDSRTVYIIDDGTERNIYVGDLKVPTVARSSRYLISYENNKYVLYLNLASNGHDNLCPIARYDNVDDAVSALHSTTINGSHDSIVNAIRDMVNMYANYELGLHECIMSIFTINQWNIDPRFQVLNDKAISYGVTSSQHDISESFRTMLHNIKSANRGSLDELYSDMYDIIVKYNWLKDKSSSTIDDVTKEICRRLNVFTLL